MKKSLLTAALIAATLAPVAAQAQDHRGNNERDRREWRQDRREDRRDWRQDRRADRREWRQDRREDRREWRQDRRADRREDWQRWRDSHRDVYRRGTWRAPFAYRNFSIGMTVPRSYWAPSYYVNNWGTYRLPAPGSRWYRYVRHYDDLLLINTRNGRVVRVYRNFYW
jgi:Ni/Co efflux regulator RcnB